jgi:hypothetical protein
LLTYEVLAADALEAQKKAAGALCAPPPMHGEGPGAAERPGRRATE